MCPICIAVAGLYAAVFRPWLHLRRRPGASVAPKRET